jgi:tRNA (adenine37-N6)-methyltransferase
MPGPQLRPGEQRLARDPADAPGDAHLVFIGRVRSSWDGVRTAPKNPTRAREAGAPATLEIDEPFRRGLAGLAGTSHIIVVVWLDRAQRDVIMLHPDHVAEPRGVFALRSPVRPNPIGLSVARVLAIDEAAGRIEVDAIDFLDGTPLLDIKPYRPGIDSVPDAVVG